jgi:hypothetical protein
MGCLWSSRKRGLNAWLTIEWHGLVSNWNKWEWGDPVSVDDNEVIAEDGD